MASARVRTYRPRPQRIIYAYTLPGVEYRKGWIKIGQTGDLPDKRILEQTKTAGIRPRLEWHDYAIYKDGSGEEFEDSTFHKWLVDKKGVERLVEKDAGCELFRLSPEESRAYFNQFANREIPVSADKADYRLRPEQAEAVEKTRAWFESGNEDQKFLWNAKPRFGKTLTAYELIQRMGFTKVLVVSNRPSISNSWAEDFYKFLSWKKEYSFVSDSEALKGAHNKKEKWREIVNTRQQYLDNPKLPRPIIAFESLQKLKGSVYFGGEHDSLRWMSELEFDLLIVDESHEGVDTIKTERAFENIRRKHTLYLSGTPFRQLASAEFDAEQIYNWSYSDEQEAKANWQGPGANPYETLPKLNLFTYQMSEIIRDKARSGIVVEEGVSAVDYAFDLNEFFAVNDSGRFTHEEDVRKFLRALTTQEKYPFSTPELREELRHTLWYLNRVDSAKALKKLLEEDEVFNAYEIILAAGNERDADNPEIKKAYDKVKNTIARHDKTITLTVGQLTVGITIPEWTAVLMLCNLSSPAAYMQAAFRAQNANFEFAKDCDGLPDLAMKENAYVFDFDPARTLVIFDEFALNLSPEAAAGAGRSEEREEKIRRLLNFLPVLGEDSEGRMVELDARQMLSLPRRLKSQEVVSRGFMSNFLFRNIGQIFGAPDAIRKIMEKLPMASEEKRKARPEALNQLNTLPVDAHGKVDLPPEIAIGDAQNLFGARIYAIGGALSDAADEILGQETQTREQLEKIAANLKRNFAEQIIAPLAENRNLSRRTKINLEKATDREIESAFVKIADKYEQKARIAQIEFEKDEGAREDAEKRREQAVAAALAEMKEEVKAEIEKTLAEKPARIIQEVEEARIEARVKSSEDEIRAHLRGFARTIPSFIMAYGDRELCLANFDEYVTNEVFEEVTGITLDNFRFLRDGGNYVDETSGRTEHFAGHVFDETVFDDAIQEFLNKKENLANYFEENQQEDIFSYIPPQKTNQIFTPRRVVELMVDLLEKENPGCFDDSTKTFADLYMKSGQYITEIIRRLFRNEAMKRQFPDERQRLCHIIENQVYGFAPNEIIYRIATRYILGFDAKFRPEKHNFRMRDAIEAARAGKLQAAVDEEFGEVR